MPRPDDASEIKPPENPALILESPEADREPGRRSQLAKKACLADPDYFTHNFAQEKFCFEDAGLPDMIFAFLALTDRTGDGIVTGPDLELAADILNSTAAAKENDSPELSYKHLPETVANVLKQWDQDQSGSVGLAELMNLDAAMKKVKSENRMVKKLLVGTIIVILILMAGMFGLSFTAAELAKETRAGDTGVLKTAGGQVAAMGGVKEDVALREFVYLAPEKLRQLKDIGFTHNDDYYNFQVSSFKLNSETKKLEFKSNDGMVLTIQETAASDVSIQFQEPGKSTVTLEGTGGRRLPEVTKSVTMEGGEEDRRLFGGGLVTSGSFSMMASTGM